MRQILYPERVFIYDVMPRDGLQIEPRHLPTSDKIALVDALSKTGVAKIEVTSFVSPRAVPNLSDAAAVFAGIDRVPGVVYTALAPNLQGVERAVRAGVNEVNLVMSASESHNRANMNMSREQSLAAFGDIALAFGRSGPNLNGTIATAFGCPFEGEQFPDRILPLVERYVHLGFGGVTLADTTGMANPRQVERLVSHILDAFPGLPLTLHFHNTRGKALANVVAALSAGASRFDATLGGIGGCPFAPGATGNICTEDLVHMFQGMGIETGVDLPALIALSRRLPAMLGHDVPGQVAKAGRSIDLHPLPKHLLGQRKHA
jgi:hydroxymethylglutaryl-CoA lyase